MDLPGPAEQNGGTVASPALRDDRNLRVEPRTVFAGEVELRVEGTAFGLRAELMDVSNNGFRAAHGYPDLLPGRVVQFSHRFFMGTAKVVWTHEMAGKTQSGFLILRG